MLASCQFYNLCVLRKILKILNFRKILKAFSPIFLNSFELWEFLLEFAVFWNCQSSLRTMSDIWSEIQKVLKSAKYVFRRSFDSFLLCWLDFLIFKHFLFWSELFLHIWTKKLRRVVKYALYVSGGAFQGIHFSKENISEKNWKKYKKSCRPCSKTSSFLSKLLSTFPTEPSYGVMKFSLKRSSFFKFSRILS